VTSLLAYETTVFITAVKSCFKLAQRQKEYGSAFLSSQKESIQGKNEAAYTCGRDSHKDM